MTADTPRTDAIEFRHCPPQPDSMLKKHEDAYALSRQLERELTASEAEVEGLRAFIKSKLPPPPYGELEPEWKYAEKLLAETAPLPEEA